jgi:hypothetical protein
MLATTIDELRTIALDADDASGYFPAMYARITDRIQAAAADGRFEDPGRMEEFALAFARWYVRPRTGQAVAAGCWQAAFDVAGDGSLMIVQHLLLGINAHVNHDLPQVVVERAPASGDLTALHADFDAVNDILAETIPSVLATLGTVSRWVNVAAAHGAGKLFDFSLRVARTRAWDTAVRLQRTETAARPAYVADLDGLVRVLAYLVANPGAPASWGVAVGRRLEEHDPRTVTTKLLGNLA